MMFDVASDLRFGLAQTHRHRILSAGRLWLGVLCALWLFPSTSTAHGGLDLPATRSYTCRFLDQDGEMCAEAWTANPQALYDWMEINIGDAGGIHQPRIPDGELCSAGRAKYGALDTPGDWPVTTLLPNAEGSYDMSFIAHAPHAAEYFRFYITREGFDPETEALAWSDLELVHDSGPISYARMASEGEDFGFRMDLPERPGRHILYLIWQRSDSLEAFYGCSDVQFSSFANENPEYPIVEEESEPPSSPDTDVSAPSPDATDASGQVHTTLTSTDDWGSGYCAEATVSNHTHSEVVWETDLFVPGAIVSYWDARMTFGPGVPASASSTTAHVRGESWNQTLAPHASTTFGFCVDRSASSSEVAVVNPSSEPAGSPAYPDEETPPQPSDDSTDPTPDDSSSSADDVTSSEDDEASTPEEDPISSGPDASTPTPSPDPQTQKPILAAYFPEWGIYGRDYFIADIPADRLTHVIYAFVDLSANGEIALFDRWAAVERVFTGQQSVSGAAEIAGNFGQLAQLKAMYPHLRVSIAVGGWTLSTHFSTALSTSQGRETASNSVLAFLTQYEMFDGVDFDWEYPGGGGLGGNSADPADGTYYALFLAEVRTKLDQLGEERGRVYEISVASPAGSGKIAQFNLSGLEASVDFFNVMTYDFHGPWESITGHLAGFESDPAGYDIQTTISLYQQAGVPREKIVLGTPLYTRAWGGVAAGQNGGYNQPSTSSAPGSFPDAPGMYDYKDLAAQWLSGSGGWELYWDDEAGAAYLYSPESRVFSSFETPGTVAFRSEWAQHMGLRGMMFWDLSSDMATDSESLIVAAERSWYGGLEFDEIVSQSDFQFEYILGGNQTFDPIAQSATSPSDITQPAAPTPEPGLCTPSSDSTAAHPRPLRPLGRKHIRRHPRGLRPATCVPGTP